MRGYTCPCVDPSMFAQNQCEDHIENNVCTVIDSAETRACVLIRNQMERRGE